MRLQLSTMIGALLLLAGSFCLRPLPVKAAGVDHTKRVIPFTLQIWGRMAPGETTSESGRMTDEQNGILTDVTSPTLTIYPVGDGKTHPTVLVLPGGAYRILSIYSEGAEIAEWLRSHDCNAAVLHYRVPDKRDGAFQDAERAMSILRSDSGPIYGIDSSRIGVMGFSAGGHLAARLAAATGPRVYPKRDINDSADYHPDFALLIYPAYLAASGQGTPETIAEAQPHPGMPPTFLAQSLDDPYLCAPAYADELKAAGVKTELRLYATGGHGYGLNAPATSPVHAWPDAAAAWLEQFANYK